MEDAQLSRRYEKHKPVSSSRKYEAVLSYSVMKTVGENVRKTSRTFMTNSQPTKDRVVIVGLSHLCPQSCSRT